MVAWGATQSLFQITLALNLAYFSLREIRTPSLAWHEIELTKAKNAASETHVLLADLPTDLPNPFSTKRLESEAHLSTHEKNLAGYERPFDENMALWEGRVRYFALGGALLSLCFLFYGTLHSDYGLEAKWLWILTAVCLSPPAFFLWYNLVLLRLMKDATREVRNIADAILSIRRALLHTDIPEYRKWRREQAEAARAPRPD
jgi:hypothetical protein